jgi:hypothetical protein
MKGSSLLKSVVRIGCAFILTQEQNKTAMIIFTTVKIVRPNSDILTATEVCGKIFFIT